MSRFLLWLVWDSPIKLGPLAPWIMALALGKWPHKIAPGATGNGNCDSVYQERDKCLVLIALMALRLGLKAGIGRHVGENWESDWRNIVFIDLPAGQVSWHIHDSEAAMFYFLGAYDGVWDGHTTEEKYQRVVEPGL